MRVTRFSVAKKDIISYFDNDGRQVFSFEDMAKILYKHRSFWRLPVNLSLNDFIGLMTDNTKLREYQVRFPTVHFIKFAWGHITPFTLAMSLKKSCYFTHYTALFLHGLTEQVPKMIYLTSELTKKSFVNNRLSQTDIDRAFANPPRISSNVATLRDYRLCLLYAKFTDRLGVKEMTSRQNERIVVTDIERTLIDAVVRPFYSGGIYEVLQAYKKAEGTVSINKLTAMLRKLGYVYPYHQAIGFLLERTGMYKESQIQLLKEFDFKYDFYLTHQIKEPVYSEQWKLYYPKGF